MPPEVNNAPIPGASKCARAAPQHASDLLGVGALHDEQVLEREERGVDLLESLAPVCNRKVSTASSVSTAHTNENNPNVAELARDSQDVFEARHALPSRPRGRTDSVLAIRSWWDLSDSALDNSENLNAHTDDGRSSSWSTKTEWSSDEQTGFADRRKGI
jgi:hypothetical protein